MFFLMGRVLCLRERKLCLVVRVALFIDSQKLTHVCMHVCMSLYAHNQVLATHAAHRDEHGVRKPGNTIGSFSRQFRSKPSRVRRGSSATVDVTSSHLARNGEPSGFFFKFEF